MLVYQYEIQLLVWRILETLRLQVNAPRHYTCMNIVKTYLHLTWLFILASNCSGGIVWA